MTVHIHAARMAEYAQDAAETDEPWLRWQVATPSGWSAVFDHPKWDESAQYRRKPRTININGIEVPEPMREAPQADHFYLPTIHGGTRFTRCWWKDDDWSRGCIARGLCHSTHEAAETHARALLSFTEVKS